MSNKIIQKENKILRETAKEVILENFKSAKIEKLLKQMTETLAGTENGVALAAPQIGVSLRIFIVNGNIWNKTLTSTSNIEVKEPPKVFINPIFKKISKKKQTVNEGCLSVENVYGTITRAEKLTIEAYDENGKKFTRGVSGLLAQVVQHEIDHLNGVLFIDSAVNLEKIKIKKEDE